MRRALGRSTGSASTGARFIGAVQEDLHTDTNFTDILYAEDKGVATITINRPKVLDAFARKRSRS